MADKQHEKADQTLFNQQQTKTVSPLATQPEAGGSQDEVETPALSADQQQEVEQLASSAMNVPALPTSQQGALETPEWLRFKLDVRFAQAFATSGLFGLRGKGKDTVPIQQAVAMAFVRMQVGKSLGFDPAQSMMGISIVNDKPVVEYPILAARCKQLGYDWETHFMRDQNGQCRGCRLVLLKNGEPVMRTKYDESGKPVQKRNTDGNPVFDGDGDPVYEKEQVSQAFTEADAKRIKQVYYRNGQKAETSLFEKDTYKNYAENMYFARAFHNLQRFHISEAINAPVFLKEAGEHEDVIDTYPSGPDKHTSVNDDPSRYAASSAMRESQRQQQLKSSEVKANGQNAEIETAQVEEKKQSAGFGKR